MLTRPLGMEEELIQYLDANYDRIGRALEILALPLGSLVLWEKRQEVVEIVEDPEGKKADIIVRPLSPGATTELVSAFDLRKISALEILARTAEDPGMPNKDSSS